MELFGSNDIGISKANKINTSSPIKNMSTQEEALTSINNVESGVKPIQLDDFFEFLDSKTVQKIIDTPVESRARITSSVAQTEYETDGARAILNSLG